MEGLYPILAMPFDQNGNIAVTGFHGGGQEGFIFISDDSDGFAALLNPSGETIWQETYKQIPQGTKITIIVQSDIQMPHVQNY